MQTEPSPITSAGLGFLGFVASIGVFAGIYNSNPGLATIVNPNDFAGIAFIVSIVFAVGFLYSMRLLLTLVAVCLLGYVSLIPIRKCLDSVQKDGFQATYDKVIHHFEKEKVEK